MMVQSVFNHNCVNGAGVYNKGPAHGRVGVNPEHRQIVNKRSGNNNKNNNNDGGKFRIGSLNVGTLRGRTGEVVETLNRRKIDVCCVQEVRWRGASARIITGKTSQYKLLWVGNNSGYGGVGIFVAKKWVEKVIEVKRVSDRLMMIKLLVDNRTVAIVSTYAPQQGLGDVEKERFYESLIQLVAKINENDMVIIGGDLNGHVGRGANGYEGVHGGCGYGVRNVEGERILEMGSALDLVVCNTWFKKRDSRLITYTSGGCATQIDYILVRNKDRKLVKDVKVIPGEEVASQHHIVVCDMKMKSCKEVRQPFIPKRKVWKLKERVTEENFVAEIENVTQRVNVEGNVEDLWKSMKEDLLTATDITCGWTKGPPRHRVTWWWNNDVDLVIKRKRQLWKEWKKGGSKEAYIEAKRVAKWAVYAAKKTAEEERFRNILGKEDDRVEVFKIAKQMKAANRDVVGDTCVRNDNGELAVTDTEKHLAWKEHYQRLLNEEFPWDKEGLEVDEPIIGPRPQIDKESVRTALNKMKKGKASGTSGVVTEMLLASGEAGIERMTNLFNRIVDEKEIPAEWNTSVIVNCFKNKGEATERGNYRGLKLLEHMMKVFERVIEQEIRRVVDIDAMQFGFMPGRGTIDAIFIVRQLQEKYLEKKKKLYLAFVDLEKAFDRVPRDVVRWAMRKLGVDEWLIETVMAMYKNSNSAVRVNNTVGEKFNVEVGVHQGSVLSPLLFIMVLEALSIECRSGLPWEMLYADDLVIIAESLEELEERYSAWKNGMECKGLRVNMAKTKVMASGTDEGPTFTSGRYPCGVCRKGVGVNSVYCTFCSQWVHKRCSGLKGRLRDVPDFKCSKCIHPQEVSETAKKVRLGNSDYEVVDQFCYLGDMLSAGGGAEASSVMRVRSGWKKFRELLPLLTSRVFSHRMKGKLYAACVRSGMLCGSKTWPVKEEDVCRIERTEMQMDV